MSVPTRVRECRACRAELPPGARFCALCGTRVVRHGAVTWEVADKRYFGVLPGRRFFRAAKVRLARLRAVVVAQLRLTRGALSVGAREKLETLRLRREAAAVWRSREQALRDLGEAVYCNEPEETERARRRVAEADARLMQVDARIRRLREDVRRRIEQAWTEDGPTKIEQPPVEPPEPPFVPEPEPVPHEPPGPVIVPEPEPVPHEPPGPVIVPEPQPPRAE
jgi:hypothetical protein